MDVRLPLALGTLPRGGAIAPRRAVAAGLRRGGLRAIPSMRRTPPALPGRASAGSADVPLAAARTVRPRTAGATRPTRSAARPGRVGRSRGRPAAALPQQVLGGRNRGLRRPRREVPQQDERAARAQDTGDLGERALVVEPVKGLRGEDPVERVVGERDLLARPGDRLGPRGAVTSRRRIASAGSTATTRPNLERSRRVSFPVPAPSSSTAAVDGRPARSMASAGQPGLPRS